MEKDAKNNAKDQEAEISFAFLSSFKKGEDVTIRDDLYDFQLLLDAAKLTRSKGIPFRLVDSGTLDFLRLEWLAREGTFIYSSDQSPRKIEELERIGKSCKRGRSFLAYFQNGPLGSESEDHSSGFQGMLRLGDEGIYIFLSNRDEKREWKQLFDLADRCRRGGSWLVYYHHGELVGDLVELAGNGAWIHVAGSSLINGEDPSLLFEIIKSAVTSDANLVFHAIEEMGFYLVNDILKAGAFLLFQSTLLDYRSPLKPLEEKASGKKLDMRAFYLYETFFF
ncbi:MAG: hypothetical protein JXB23_03120 [Candidatus Aminicenantes bacterium]|nr:hypothetical protein [Candidatus Aminicenantes bacterium]